MQGYSQLKLFLKACVYLLSFFDIIAFEIEQERYYQWKKDHGKEIVYIVLLKQKIPFQLNQDDLAWYGQECRKDQQPVIQKKGSGYDAYGKSEKIDQWRPRIR